tara:strand:- start:653 stop:2602 length:1950 start_codon:yes stop_codon:yes gene_type:complete
MDRLTSGKRINSAADDAAGLQIASGLTSQIRGLDQAVRNANDGISMVQTAEGALQESTNMLQRMRELSIQSASGTFTEGNRSSLNAEVTQLKAELTRIAETTTFNGLNILDGSLGSTSLQVGSEANQTIGIDFGSQSFAASQLGAGAASGDIVGKSISDVGITDGDVFINGKSIGTVAFSAAGADASDNMDELLSAINTNISGVTASALAEVKATTAGDGILTAAETFAIKLTGTNGVDQTITVSNTSSLEELASKINEQGGGLVEASITDEGYLALSSTAAEIEVTDGAAAGGTGITTATTAKLVLTSDDGGDITVTRGATGTLADLASLGLRESTVAGTVEGEAVNGTLFAADDLKINGVQVGASLTGGLVDKIAAINAVSDQSGVEATAFSSATLELGAATVAQFVTAAGAGVEMNGAAISFTGDTTMADLAASLNAATDETGITATVSGTRLLLEGNASSIAFDNVVEATDSLGALNTATVTLTSGSTEGATVLAAKATISGGIKLTSENGSPVAVEHKDAAAALKTGMFDQNVTVGGTLGASIEDVDISTAAGAQKAIETIDKALETINSARGEMGAVTNRLNFTVNNLSSVSQSASASRSRIEDADFAAESAALSRAQVLQQAGTAMLAQANAAPQQVLSLLQ